MPVKMGMGGSPLSQGPQNFMTPAQGKCGCRNSLLDGDRAGSITWWWKELFPVVYMDYSTIGGYFKRFVSPCTAIDTHLETKLDIY